MESVFKTRPSFVKTIYKIHLAFYLSLEKLTRCMKFDTLIFPYVMKHVILLPSLYEMELMEIPPIFEQNEQWMC